MTKTFSSMKIKAAVPVELDKVQSLRTRPLKHNKLSKIEGLRTRAFSTLTTSHRGLALIEILIAIVLAAFLVTTFVGMDGKPMSDLDKAIDSVERAIRYAVNESVLRGSIVRVQFDLEKNPIEYVIQYGPTDGFVLPEAQAMDDGGSAGLSEAERAAQAKLSKKIDSQFLRIPEFESDVGQLSETVRLVGVGTSLKEKIVMQGKVSLYIYPSGEKDDFLVLMADSEEMVELRVLPFQEEIQKDFHKVQPMDPNSGQVPAAFGTKELSDKQDKLAEELFKAWKKGA